jgi:hypothetical protein
MNAAVGAIREHEPIELDPRPCTACGLTIDRHDLIDDGDGPMFFCADIALNDMTLDELERRAELIQQEEVAAIFARLEAADDPSKRSPSTSEPEPYRPARSTIDAFRYLAAAGDVGRIRDWLADRPNDAPHLLSMLED